MKIKEIFLKDYRNYKEEKAEFDSLLNVFLGENAQGKTNLLESIYLCSIGKSFRTNRHADMVRFGEDFCRVSLDFEGEKEGTIDMVVTKEGKRAAKINGGNVERMKALMEELPIVIFSPEDLKISKEDPEKRRLFMNREISQMKPSYLQSIAGYNRVLSQRNAYLKETRPEEEILAVWEEQLAGYGAVIMEERKDFLQKISLLCEEKNKKITEEKENFQILYRPNVEKKKTGQKEYLKEILKEQREKDIEKGSTGKGPHKDDFEILINGKNVRYYGSQGQQRTAALVIKLAEIELMKEERKEIPILLLDDVMSELDGARQKYLIQSLHQVQTFITMAEISREMKRALEGGRIFFIRKGKIEE